MKAPILKLLNKYRHTCWLEGEPLGNYKGRKLGIKLTKDVVVNRPPYRIPHCHQEKLDNVIKTMLQQGVITRSTSDFNAPLIIVSKPGGEIRPCLDFRALNSVTEPMVYPIPRIGDLLSSMKEAKVISSLDLASTYHHGDLKP